MTIEDNIQTILLILYSTVDLKGTSCNIPGGMLWDGSGYHHVCV